MTVAEHLDELRTRLIRVLIGVTAAGGLCFWRMDWLVAILRRPLAEVMERYPDTIVMTQKTVYDGFAGAMKLAFLAGCVVGSPVILWQIWAFVGAGLYGHERRAIKFYAIPGFVLFLLGAWLAYAFVLPLAFDFLVGYASDELRLSTYLQWNEHVGLVAMIMFVFGLMFQLPVVMVFLMRIGVVEPATFRRYRRHAIVLAFVVGMVLTPPDVVSQTALASCLLLLYEGAILVGARVAKPRGENS